MTGYFHSQLIAIHPKSVEIETPEGPKTLKNDFVFAMIGYHPDLKFMEALGIRLDPKLQKPRINSETFESDRPGVFLAGVIVAGMHTNEIFIENGRFHGKQIADAIADSLAPSSLISSAS